MWKISMASPMAANVRSPMPTSMSGNEISSPIHMVSWKFRASAEWCRTKAPRSLNIT
jgi:hypothetical protein